MVARAYGAGIVVDTYFIGLSLPLLVGGVLSAAIMYHVVPMIIQHNDSKISNGEIKAATLETSRKAGGIICALGFVGTIVQVLQYTNSTAYLHNNVLLISLNGWLGVWIGNMTSVMIAICHSRKQFIKPSLYSLTPALVSLLAGSWSLFSHGSILWVSFGLLAGQLIVFILLNYEYHRQGGKWVSGPDARRHILRDTRGLILVVLSMLVYTVYSAVDSLFGAWVGAGTVTCLAYGQRITVALAGLAVNGASVVMLPLLSESVAKGESEKVSVDTANALLSIIIVLMPIAFAMTILGEPTLRMLFKGGEFNEESISRLNQIVPFLMVGMIPMSAATLIYRNLYAKRDLKFAAQLGCIGGFCYFASVGLLTKFTNLGMVAFGIAYCLTWFGVAFIGLGKIITKNEWNTICKEQIKQLRRLALIILVFVLVVVLCRENTQNYFKTLKTYKSILLVAYLVIGLLYAAAIFALKLVKINHGIKL
jgi:peptidoglycan biosynthesis protein MviN/MurJ (putative lipid II flippase)